MSTRRSSVGAGVVGSFIYSFGGYDTVFTLLNFENFKHLNQKRPRYDNFKR